MAFQKINVCKCILEILPLEKYETKVTKNKGNWPNSLEVPKHFFRGFSDNRSLWFPFLPESFTLENFLKIPLYPENYNLSQTSVIQFYNPEVFTKDLNHSIKNICLSRNIALTPQFLLKNRKLTSTSNS